MEVTYNSSNDTITISGDIGSNTSVTLYVMNSVGARAPGYPMVFNYPGGGGFVNHTTGPLGMSPPYTVVVITGSSVESATVP